MFGYCESELNLTPAGKPLSIRCTAQPTSTFTQTSAITALYAESR